jgi:16S rRNA (cytidine1402-2'-O)-methyltransferase
MSKKNPGTLYLFPTPIGDLHQMEHLPFNNELLLELDIFFVEELKTARRYLRKNGYTKDFEEITLNVINEHSKELGYEDWLKPILEGKDGGLMSEAGMPCIADPGAVIVAEAHRMGIPVVPLTGPSSIMLTLAASGLNGQTFTFHGYLPRERGERMKKIKMLERQSSEFKVTQLFMDAPYRSHHVYDDLREHLQPTTLLCIGCDVHSQNGYVITKTIAQWRDMNWDFNKRNVIFAIGIEKK